MGEVAGGGARRRHGEERVTDVVEQAGQCRPRRGDLHRVDHEAPAGQRLQCGGVIAVFHPLGDQRLIGR